MSLEVSANKLASDVKLEVKKITNNVKVTVKKTTPQVFKGAQQVKSSAPKTPVKVSVKKTTPQTFKGAEVVRGQPDFDKKWKEADAEGKMELLREEARIRSAHNTKNAELKAEESNNSNTPFIGGITNFFAQTKSRERALAEAEDGAQQLQIWVDSKLDDWENQNTEWQNKVLNSKTEDAFNRNYRNWVEWDKNFKEHLYTVAGKWEGEIEGLYEYANVPLDESGFIKAVKTADFLTTPIQEAGKATWNTFIWVTDLPKRFVNTTLNLASGERKIWTDGETVFHYQDRSGNVISDIKEAWNESYRQSYTRPVIDNDGSKLPLRLLDSMYEIGLDPAMWFGAGEIRALTTKGTKYVSKFKYADMLFNKADDFSKFLKGNKYVAKAIAPYKSFKVRRSDAISKLWDDTVGAVKADKNALRNAYKTSVRQYNRLKTSVKRDFGKIFDDLSDNEITAFQVYIDVRKIGGTAEDFVIALGNKIDDIDLRKVAQKVDDLKQWANDLYLAERKAGIKYTKQEWYRPVYRNSDDLVSDGVIKEWRPGFTKAQKGRNIYSRDELADVYVKRQMDSMRARGANPYVDDYLNFWRQRHGYKFYNSKGELVEVPGLDNTEDFMRGLFEAEKDELIKNFKPSMWEQVRKPADMAEDLWRKSVLNLRPAWHINNMAYNHSAGITAGGADYLRNLRPKNMAQAKKLVSKLTKDQQDEVLSTIFLESGAKQLKLADQIENASRIALYKAMRDKGLDHKQAVKIVNQWLYDYTVHNWERPFRAVMPFFKWQENIIRNVATMPFRTPRGASVWKRTYEELYGMDDIPEEQQQYYAGTAKIPFTDSKRVGTPFNAFRPDELERGGLNPFLATILELADRKDYYGNDLRQSLGRVIMGKFPQADLFARAFIDKPKWDKYLAEGSLFTKERLSYDPHETLGNKLLAFVGFPRIKEFDTEEYEARKNEEAFLNEFFNVDWDKPEFKTERNVYENGEWIVKDVLDFKKVEAYKEQVAKNYGFDLVKDVYEGIFQRNDTLATEARKVLKEEARLFNSEFYDEYGEKDMGIYGKKRSERQQYLAQKYQEFIDEETLNNPYFAVIQDYWNVPKIIQDEKDYQLKKQRYESGYYLEQYKKSPKGKFWQGYFDREGVDRIKWYAENYKPEYGGDGIENPDETLFWLEYFASDPDTQREMLLAHPEYDRYKDEPPLTPDEWEALRDKQRLERMKLFEKDIAFMEELRQKREELERSIPVRLKHNRVQYL